MHLLDEPTRSKNPLKKAMRRRNGRRVDFSAPTYYDANEVDWSDDEAAADLEDGANGSQRAQDASEQQSAQRDPNGLDSQANGQEVADNNGRVAADDSISTQGPAGAVSGLGLSQDLDERNGMEDCNTVLS